MSSVLWQTVLGEIEVSISPASYKTWFKNTNFMQGGICGAVIGVSNMEQSMMCMTSINQEDTVIFLATLPSENTHGTMEIECD